MEVCLLLIGLHSLRPLYLGTRVFISPRPTDGRRGVWVRRSKEGTKCREAAGMPTDVSKSFGGFSCS